ncbi:YkgJ family cysteine cluster protein [Thermodesulfitimonas autotrophica]|uniref:YkgJ family cysteine cluster protein n=1 Tax=Thermodesulfitimonas autotrophica TaxID=1894989 RepID=UPI0014745338|nr:YkgJ family cysteine cluster protein [Thermodesulfitimonas autotrophica]
MAVKVLLQRFGAAQGYDLVITAKRATVQDYLDALNRAFTGLELTRVRRPEVRACRGCDRCCAERAPLTIIDSFLLSRVTGCSSLSEFLSRYGYVAVTGPVVDITLRRLDDGYCIFLDRQARTCRVYPVRPFVCQTFFCCPATGRALAVREAVVNSGEDELVRRWLKTRRVVHYADRPHVNPRDWLKNPFTGRWRYDAVRLRALLPGRLWRELYVPQQEGRRSRG